jgi:indolepyruvate ferredoxin oxidoreductase alpha subunit
VELKLAAEPAKALRERSFARDVDKLKLGAGDVFRGEAIVALAKAFLQAGVAYVGGYPGAPVSHLLDVLADARDDVLGPLGVQLEASASEAGAAALLGASIHYPLRGAVAWKSIVGTNVASDALSNLASAGVAGGALVIVGEDYGEGASVIQERTYAFAMKSTLPLIEPRYDLPHMVDLVEAAFALSEACRLPVLYSLRIRAAHMTGRFVCKDNRSPSLSLAQARLGSTFDYGKIVLPPSTYAQEQAKFSERLPAARRFISERGLNEHFPGAGGRFGIILQGGAYGTVMRGLALLGAADARGASDVPLLVLNVTFPLVSEELRAFLDGKDSVLVVEEGNPAFIEQQVRALAHEAGLEARIHGKDVLPSAGEYTADVVRDGLARFLEKAAPESVALEARRRAARIAAGVKAAQTAVPALPARPPGFCTGCPERPIFTALKLLQRERGAFHVSSDIGCNTFSTQPPFFMGSTVLGYGLSLASAGAVGAALDQPAFAVMGDGGFWHNGIGTGAINAHWNGHDAVLLVLDNGYASATGQQHVPSSGSTPWGRRANVSIEDALRGIGVRWIRRTDAYDVRASLETIRAAFDARGPELRVVIADRECMLARRRRERPVLADAERRGKPVAHGRFGVDAEACVGDHPCMRLNGCPSLTLHDESDPLKDGPAARIAASCLDCGLCGEIAHVAGLCPSFYRATRHANAGWTRRAVAHIEAPLMKALGAS